MSSLAEAQRRAARLYPRSKPFRNTYMRGARAALNGSPVDVCPYARQSVNTWRNAFRLAWLRGYQSIRVG